jgi:predicted nucleotidyltransferase
MISVGTLASILRIESKDVRLACRVGSRVYGTAGPTSDEDFVVVLSKPGQKQDLAFADGINIVVHGVGTFQQALDDQSVFALEGFFAPSEHVLVAAKPPFKYSLDQRKLAISATEKSRADWQKGIKKFLDEPGPSRKKLFHSLRVPAFALQVSKSGKLTDFTIANAWFEDIMTGPDDDVAWYDEQFGKIRESMGSELMKLAEKR